MGAILDLRDGVGMQFASLAKRVDRVERGLDTLRYGMNKRFDSVDLRFDAFERRVNVLDQR